MSFGSVLFDLDGTLTDSGPGITASVRYVLAELGLPQLDDLQLRSFVGPPLADSFRDVVGLDPARAQQAVAVYRGRYTEIGMYDNAVYPGIPELLEALVADGRRLAVATSKLTVTAVAICEHFGIDHYFEAICGADLAGLRHAKADIVFDALAVVGVSRGSGVGGGAGVGGAGVGGDAGVDGDAGVGGDAVLVGDRSYDVAGASANGISCIGAGWGYGAVGELVAAGADVIAASVSELAGLLGP